MPLMIFGIGIVILSAMNGFLGVPFPESFFIGCLGGTLGGTLAAKGFSDYET